MATRSAEAVWNGNLKEGNGTMKLGSGAYEGKYSFASRFESGQGTNPEELVGAAHAGCFSMALSGSLARAGSPPARLNITARVTFDKGEAGWRVVSSALTVRGVVPGATADSFREAAEAAKDGCPISQALKGNVALSVEATLEEG